jgi:hypothetical protein
LASLNMSGGETSDDDLKIFPIDLGAAIKLYVPYMIGWFFAYKRALWNGEITWASAKQKALSAAFGNAGVDEGIQPEKKFRSYGGSYDDYLNDFMSHEKNQSGFSRFMNHPVTGYAEAIGEIKPGSGSPSHIISGYGWSQLRDTAHTSSEPSAFDEVFCGSYYEHQPEDYPPECPSGINYDGYDNYVEVQVKGSSSYPFEPLTWSDLRLVAVFGVAAVFIGAFIKYCTWGMGLCGLGLVGVLIALAFAAIVAAFYATVMATLPIGYTFPGRNMENYTDKNPIKLQVTRYKKNTDMGIWNFQYGKVIAKSAGHAFVVDNNGLKSTIEPVFISGFSFNASGHLFETELVKGSVE